MNSIIQKIQNFIKEEKKDLKQFEILKIILSEHLISKNLKIKDLNFEKFIYFIDDIRDYIYVYNFQNSKYEELNKEIEIFLYENHMLSF
tara:strand:- start:146 stop:412 length:267 start_codon:yes stop_codon:yes gene_type:complete